MLKVKSFKKLKSGKKKYEITFEKNGKTYVRKFGAAGMSDFTIHKDRERRERYISRHKKDLKTGDPMKPGYLSMYILWNKPSIKASLADYKRRLNVYNRTGKFPKSITGSKKLSFGTIIPFRETTLDILPTDVQEKIQKNVSAQGIQKNVKKFLQGRDKIIRILKNLGDKNYRQTGNKNFLDNLLLNYDITTSKGVEITKIANKLLTKDDFKDKSFWWSLINTGLTSMNDIYREMDTFSPDELANFEQCEILLIDLVNRAGISWDFTELENPNAMNDLLLDWENLDNNSFGKKNKTSGSKIPGNVINKTLYSRIKSKIKKSIKGRRWGAYDSGRLVREYKAAGGAYTGRKGKTDLSRWYKEKWIDACAWPKRKPCGRRTKSTIAYCRPSVKVDSKTPKLVQQLTKAQIKSRCAKKKKSPMKRVTKFGKTTPDVEIGNGWVIHCNFIPGIGPHATLRRKDIAGPTRDTDHAFRYGIKYPDRAPEFWSSGPLAKGLPSVEFQNLLMDYYYNNCGGWHLAKLPPPSPIHYSRFGNSRSLHFYKELMKIPADPVYATEVLKQQLKLRCGSSGNQKCDDYLIELYLNIFHTVKDQLPRSNLRRQIIDTIKPIENEFRKRTGYKFTHLPIKKPDYTKIKIVLGLMQDEVLEYTKNVAYLDSAVLAYLPDDI